MKNKNKWSHFEYKSGCNPYIAMTENKKRSIFRKYGGKEKIKLIKKTENINFYLINDLKGGF